MTKINFQSLYNRDPVKDVYDYLIKYDSYNPHPRVRHDAVASHIAYRGRNQEDGLHDYYDLDLLGQHLVWANDNFPSDKYLWYHWFESIFIVPPEMYSFYLAKWS